MNGGLFLAENENVPTGSKTIRRKNRHVLGELKIWRDLTYFDGS